MKAHIGVDAESGLVHTVQGTSGKSEQLRSAYAIEAHIC
jgi:hypothetical protein